MTSKGFQTIRDSSSNIEANTDIFFEFAWDENEIDNYLVKLNIIYREILK